MIVRHTESSQLLITQPDHAALAGRIMRCWRAGGLQGSPRLREILVAIEEHDNGWREVDAAPIVCQTTGQILDFVNAPDVVRQGVWPRGVERLAETPYAAALVAQHALHIYQRYAMHPDWQPFFERMQELRGRHLRQVASAGLDELMRDYVFVRLGDLVSLAFCAEWNDAPAEGGYTVRNDGRHVVIAPDPFAGQTIPIEIIATVLPDRRFSSTSDVQTAMASAPKRVLTGMVCGG
jgi:hypothetical protein